MPSSNALHRPTPARGIVASFACMALLSLSACGDEPETGDSSTTPTSAAEDPSQTSNDETFTMEDVEDNDSADSCWAVMDDAVYDLTAWIDDHPGGGTRIEQLCGTDASEAFEAQHGGQDRPEEQLTEFEIGTLAD
ncbi:cytochrome b5 domain-containing protein [Nesterenkonia haasae]|uniref:cytochrome b5 domain-containing protein n=1 Tax=Nesterenkonia haasae TaxID=2587813 RepID=UPI001391C865|nr:cytochrome b5-like heme/steroid binding domain-containing protein [Nesterenkonia haasae]NDK30994.1 monooxygenase [Nesterenkonia haasae]